MGHRRGEHHDQVTVPGEMPQQGTHPVRRDQRVRVRAAGSTGTWVASTENVTGVSAEVHVLSSRPATVDPFA